MFSSDFIFIGKKDNPFYMIEVIKEEHLAIIYRPDKYSEKMKDFFEKYYLGETFEVKYSKIIYIKNKYDYYSKAEIESEVASHLLPEILIKSKNKYIWIKDCIKES